MKPKWNFKKGTPVKVVIKNFPYIGKFIGYLGKQRDFDICSVEFAGEFVDVYTSEVYPIEGVSQFKKGK